MTPPIPWRRLHLLWGLLPALAAAQTENTHVGVAQSVVRDNNLYRVADGATLPGGLARDDTVATSTVEGGLKLPLGRQLLRAQAKLHASRFQHNKSLDNTGHGLKLALDWATIERLSGNVQVSRERSLVRFGSDTQGASLQRNLGTTTQFDAAARVGLVTRWSGELLVSHQRADYSAVAFASREFRQNSVATSLWHSPGGANRLSLGVRAVEGRYPRFAMAANGSAIADRYQGRYFDLGAHWAPGAVSQFDARLSLGNTRFDRATASDVTGLTGSAGWIWRPTGKLRLEWRLARDRGQDSAAQFGGSSGAYTDFSRTTTALSLGLTYELSAKIVLTGGASHAQRQLVDTRQDLFGKTAAVNGDDRTTLFSLGARWVPVRALTLGCDISRERRRHDGPLSSDFAASSVSCFGQFTLQ